VIWSFSDTITEKRFLGEEFSQKETNKPGTLNLVEDFELLAIFNEPDEKPLLLIPALRYHKLSAILKYSNVADSRKSPWRNTYDPAPGEYLPQWERSGYGRPDGS
jgi:hypothetical protein